MYKKVVTLFVICALLTMFLPVYAQEEERPALEKPESFTARIDEYGHIVLRLKHSDRIMQLIKDGVGILCEFDWKINDGPWQFDNKWDDVNEQGLFEYYESQDADWAVQILGNYHHEAENALDIWVYPESLQLEEFDFQNNTYYFRYRYLYEYSVYDEAADVWGYRVEAYPYSDIAAVGKDAEVALPDSIRESGTLRGELKNREDTGLPYFYFTCDIPESIKELNKKTKVWNEIDWKIGNDKWASEKGELLVMTGVQDLWDNIDFDPIDEGRWGEIDIKENTYYFRMRFCFQNPNGSIVYSPFSNVVQIGVAAFYQKASEWAEGELKDAYEKDLIPDILIGADMTQPITREEFAELAVRLCEKTIDEDILPASPNPFTDTTNPQILKAYKLGITTGTSKTAFSPNLLINREQCATMLYRAIKAIAPNADYSIDGVKDFPDQKDISDWAVEGTKYMFKLGIIKGDSNGNFMPKAVTTAQEAAGYGMATREAAILMTVRTFDKLPEIELTTAQPTATPTPQPTAAPTPEPNTAPTPAPQSSSGGMELSALEAKSSKINQLYYEWTQYVDGEKYNEGKVWMKGSKVKKEDPLSTGGTMIYIYDMEKGLCTSYSVGGDTAHRWDYDLNDPGVLEKPTGIRSWFVPEDVIFKPAGTETMNGQVCTVLVGESEGMEVIRIWVSEETGLKLREDYVLGPDAPRALIEYNYIIVDDVPIDDSVFEIPAGMTIEEMDF